MNEGGERKEAGVVLDCGRSNQHPGVLEGLDRARCLNQFSDLTSSPYTHRLYKKFCLHIQVLGKSLLLLPPSSLLLLRSLNVGSSYSLPPAAVSFLPGSFGLTLLWPGCWFPSLPSSIDSFLRIPSYIPQLLTSSP